MSKCRCVCMCVCVYNARMSTCVRVCVCMWLPVDKEVILLKFFFLCGSKCLNTPVYRYTCMCICMFNSCHLVILLSFHCTSIRHAISMLYTVHVLGKTWKYPLHSHCYTPPIGECVLPVGVCDVGVELCPFSRAH